MQVLLAVIDDLFLFVRTSLFGVKPTLQKNEQTLFETQVRPLELQGPTTPPLIEVPQSQSNFEPTFSTGKQYYIGADKIYIHADPVVSFDSAYTIVPYASAVELIKFGGRWAQVQYGATVGWILKDALYEKAADVFPTLVAGVMHGSENKETIKLRSCIADMFGAGRANLALTGAEYVVYCIEKHKREIPWPNIRPRIPGTWQRLLRGKHSVHIGVSPKTNSMMEYIMDDVGYVAFVDAVFPDGSMKVSGVGLITDGQYTELTMSKDDWRELRPVFIEVS